MKLQYVLFKNGFQGRGATTLAEMGVVEVESIQQAIDVVKLAHPELTRDDEHIPFFTLAPPTLLG